MKRIVIFSIIVLLSHSLLASENEYKYYCDVHVHHLELLDYVKKKLTNSSDDSLEKLKILNTEIVNALEKAFNDVWIDFENNNSKIKDENIRNAIEKLRKKVSGDDLLNSNIYEINFYLDTIFLEWFREKFGLKEKTLKKYILADCMDVHGRNDGINSIDIYNGVGDFKWNNFRYVDPETGCEYEVIIKNSVLAGPMDAEKRALIAKCRDETDMKYSIKSALFHELVHIALKDAGIDRWMDEATVEDIMLQLYPRGSTGFNLYESSYDLGLIVNEFKYYPDGGRQFNPRIEFKMGSEDVKLYYYPSEEVGIKRDGVKVEGLSCDDATTSHPYKKFMIPYAKCCGADPLGASSKE